MLTIGPYRATHLKDLVRVWNVAFEGRQNYLRLTDEDLRRRVTDQPGFSPDGLLVAEQDGDVMGFVHIGFRANLWHRLEDRRLDRAEGHIYTLVARPEGTAATERLLVAALEAFCKAGSERVLLGPSWVYGTQPFYNCIAGAYEIPGFDPTRREMVSAAEAQGFREVAEYGTPELDLGKVEQVAELREKGRELLAQASSWGLVRRIVSLETHFFPPRKAVLLERGTEMAGMTAFGPWPEYERGRGRRLFGITSVQVSPGWRGRGLGKLAVILAMEAAMAEGAEGLHLHVYRSNKPAWGLYHEALGFQPKCRWVTLAKELA